MEAVAPDRRLADRYVLVEAVATGGMATLWRGIDEVLARTVAVKVLRRDLARDPEFFTRFQTEAVAAARLTHPCIISVFDTGVQDGVSYIIMEYFDGATLRAIMDQRGAIEAAESVDVLLPVLSALAFAHSMGVVHRDVKPANILVAQDGRVKVTDFGIAKAAFARHNLTTTGSVLGTVRYLSPEQVQGAEVDGRSDLYSAGVVLYELLTGRPPFRAETDVATAMMRLTTDPLPPCAVRPRIPRGLEAAVMRSLARRPEDRFHSAEAMRAALERFADQGQPTAQQGLIRPVRTEALPVTPPVAGRGAFRSWMLVPLLVIAVAAATILAGLAVGRLKLGGPLGIRGAASSPAPASGGTVAVHIAGAKDFDPPPGDGSEHPESVPLAIDGNPSTSWTTAHYSSAAFGNLKSGVGLWIDLGGPKSVTRVVVSSSLPGWAFQLKAGTLQGLSGALPSTSGATTFTIVDAKATVDLRSVRTSGILIWITKLAPDAGRYAATIAEVNVFGAAG